MAYVQALFSWPRSWVSSLIQQKPGPEANDGSVGVCADVDKDVQSKSVTKQGQDRGHDTNRLEDGFTAAAARQPETLSQPGTASAESGEAFIATEAPRTIQTTTEAFTGEDTDCGGTVFQAQARDVVLTDVVLTEGVTPVAEVDEEVQSESVTKHEQDHTKDTNKLEDGFTAAADRQPETLSQPGTAAAESGDAFIATEAPRTVQTTTQASAGEDTDCGGKVVQAQARDVVLTESVAHVAEVGAVSNIKQQSRQQHGNRVAATAATRRRLEKTFGVQQLRAQNPHSNLQARHRMAQVQLQRTKKRLSEAEQAHTALSQTSAALQASLEKSNQKMQQLVDKQLESGMTQGQIDELIEVGRRTAREAAQEKEDAAAATATAAAAAAAATAAKACEWLTEPAASDKRLPPRRQKGKAQKAKPSRKHKPAASERGGATPVAEELVESDDDEDVATDIMPDSHEGLLQLARWRYGPDAALPPPPSCPTHARAAAQKSLHSQGHKAPPASSTLAGHGSSKVTRLHNSGQRALKEWKVQMKGRRALEFIARQRSNWGEDGRLTLFLPRPDERPAEVWKIDLHMPTELRERDFMLSATLIAEATGIYLNILRECLYDFLPEEGITIVTGRGRETGGQTFIKVGDLLFRLLGTVVSCYTAHQSEGAYTVWLLPLKPGDRLRKI